MEINNLPDPDDFNCSTPVQMRFNDIDIFGHVNNNAYLAYYDCGKFEYYNKVHAGVRDWTGTVAVIVNINCSFLTPVRLGDSIEVLTRCTALHEKSFVLQQMLVDTRTRQPKSCCESVVVCIDAKSGKSVGIPDEWRQLFCGFEKRDLNADNCQSDKQKPTT